MGWEPGAEGDRHRKCPPQLGPKPVQSRVGRAEWPITANIDLSREGMGTDTPRGCPGRPAGNTMRWDSSRAGKETKHSSHRAGYRYHDPRQGVGVWTRCECLDKVWVSGQDVGAPVWISRSTGCLGGLPGKAVWDNWDRGTQSPEKIPAVR